MWHIMVNLDHCWYFSECKPFYYNTFFNLHSLIVYISKLHGSRLLKQPPSLWFLSTWWDFLPLLVSGGISMEKRNWEIHFPAVPWGTSKETVAKCVPVMLFPLELDLGTSSVLLFLLYWHIIISLVMKAKIYASPSSQKEVMQIGCGEIFFSTLTVDPHFCWWKLLALAIIAEHLFFVWRHEPVSATAISTTILQYQQSANQSLVTRQVQDACDEHLTSIAEPQKSPWRHFKDSVWQKRYIKFNIHCSNLSFIF